MGDQIERRQEKRKTLEMKGEEKDMHDEKFQWIRW